MASKTSTKTNTKKSQGKSKTSARTKAAEAAAYYNPPDAPDIELRQSLKAGVCFVLAVLVCISYFTSQGSFIEFFSGFVKGLVGWGYWILALILVMIAVILLKNKGKPCGFKIFCALMIPVVFSAMISISVFSSDNIVEPSDFGRLYSLGQELKCGGLVSGFIGVVFERAFSVYGAYALLILALIFFVMKSLNSGLSDIAVKIRSDAERYYEYDEPYSDKEEEEVPVQKKAPAKKTRNSSFPVDIPLGDDEFAEVTTHQTRGAAQRTKVPVITEIPRSASDPALPRTSSAKRSTAPVSIGTENVKPLSEADAKELFGMGESRADAVKVNANKRQQKISRDEIAAEADIVTKEIAKKSEANDSNKSYCYPPYDLLNPPIESSGDSKEEILTNKNRLESALRSFGINAGITSITHGPTVTRYDIELEQGVKLSKVTNLAGDLALSLGVVNVRIAPIPDKISTVGIEVPNRIVTTVYLREIISSEKFNKAKSKLSFAIGKDIGGECIVGNISKLPHMLIAGTTGSGKSVCMNSLILSLLYKAKPDEVKMIMIDPKMVELGVYNGIPHLYVPVVTDPKKASGALQWSVVEMLKRYRLFSEASVRDLESYNKYCDENKLQRLPSVVIVIDELADLMIAASKEVEESICRVAQMGRAAGMHLIIATQRPSADVITGLMKANIPSRIAFAVSSALESRIIMDQTGAEKLVGMGDMLYSPVGCGKPTRIQGAYVSDEEREKVIQFVKEECGSATVLEEITEFMNRALESGKDSGSGSKSSPSEHSDSGYDDMISQAAAVVIENKSCSVSMLQRRLKLGYSRAARIVDQMEELGVVGQYEGSKPRSVLIDMAQWKEIASQLGIASDDDMSLAREISAESEGM